MAQIASLLVPGVNIPQYDGSSWLATLGNALEERGQKKEARQLVQESFSGVAPQQQGGFLSNLKGMVTGQQPGAPNGGFLSRLSGQSAPARAPQTVDVSGDKATFVNALLPAAIEESKRTGVDPRLIVAQAAQETGWGKSAPGNNYFGIKSHGQGGGQNLTTHEVINGQRVKINDSFRTFESPAHSVRGYGDFLLQNPRYRQLREAQGLDNQVAALQASGYATDPNYGNSVGAIARSIQLPAEQPQTAADAIEAIAPLNGAPTPQVAPQGYAGDAGWMTYDQNGARVERSTLSDSAPGAISQQNFDDRFGPVPLPSETPAQGVDGLRAGLEQQPPAAPAGIAAAAPPATYAPAPQSPPVQVADASGTVGYSAPPAPAGGSPVQVNADLLGRMVTNPYTRDMGIALWKTTVEGRKQGYDFMMAPDGTLLRTDKAGNVEVAGNFAKPVDRSKPNLVNAGDGRLYDADNKQWVVAPQSSKPGFRQASSQEAQQYGAPAGQFGPDGRFYPVNPPQGTSLQVDPATGAVSFSQGAGVKPLTEGQSKDTVYSVRARGALATLDKYADALQSLPEQLGSGVPVAGNYLKSTEYQQAEQAGREFLQAILRKDTGAAIAKSETEEYGVVYLPQPGDSKEVLAQKKISRERALNALEAGMPPAAILQQERALAKSAGNGTVQIKTAEDYQSLPSGTTYQAPDGSMRRKP